ncbi:hypothetical protein LSH36_31g04034 [Paralvinella palmiformis]|uniref:HECT-type E3 ubiquitin transferase n=1 Tax=Paralvinella palmiformis TaxID=53620 RepID=A0AAD9K9N2_9ANNE|nr:hypothetical protein LSH36_31g04034 [Paralvinella palmiformis]
MNQTRGYDRTPNRRLHQVDWYRFRLILLTSAIVFILCVGQIYKVYIQRQRDWNAVQIWLKNHELTDYENTLYSTGIRNMDDIANTKLPLDKDYQFKSPSPGAVAKVEIAVRRYQDEMLLTKWLQDHSLEKYLDRLLAEDVYSLELLARVSELKSSKLLGSKASKYDKAMFQRALLSLRKLAPNFSQYKSEQMFGLSIGSIVGGLFCVAFLTIIYYFVTTNPTIIALQSQLGSKQSLLDFVIGHYLAAGKTTVEWKWTDNEVVGQTFCFSVKFFSRNGWPYSLPDDSSVVVEISQGSNLVKPMIQKLEPNENGIKVKFTILKSGTYKISILLAGKHISGSPFSKSFLSGPMNPTKSQFINQGSLVVGCKGKALTLVLEPRDSYNNPCDYSSNRQLTNQFHVLLTETNSQRIHKPTPHCRYLKNTKKLTMSLTIDATGCYYTVVRYKDELLKNSEFHAIILSENELIDVEKAVAKKCHNISFDARLLSTNYLSPSDRGKKIQCYISPKQLTIKEFHLKIIPKKLFAFRVCPSTKFQFLGIHNQLEVPVLSISDGREKPVLLASKDRDIIAATFSKILMKNIGGSETFTDKRDFFYHEIRQLHAKRIHYRLAIKINREKLLENSVKATKNFSTSDWCKNFEITFQNEEGLDWGGLKREWFEMLSTEIFDPTKSGMFIRFNDDPQALAHPNHQLPPGIKLKYWEFAGKIVGKCLYESALGGGYRLQVRAKFTRSFLAQLIGLRVNYKYFEKDDPDLYTQKICYIENNDVDDLDLTFSEEEFYDGKLIKVVELLPNGSKTPVTNTNKKKYLDLLAQFRLSTRVRDQMDAFLKGLNELIPDNLLSIFDENELELLICGTGEYSIEDFKKHHTICSSSLMFLKMVEWFWEIVSSYSQEEMARLLQFTTGCSQLPPGGFSELVPQFQLTSSQTYKVLPTAHTCFNQLCIPDYDSMDEMREALHIAITEGNQGFCMV